MKDITNSQGECCCVKEGNCVALAYAVNAKKCTPITCAFYKPVGCDKMIRRDTDEGVFLFHPEEIMDRTEVKAYYDAQKRFEKKKKV